MFSKWNYKAKSISVRLGSFQPELVLCEIKNMYEIVFIWAIFDTVSHIQRSKQGKNWIEN